MLRGVKLSRKTVIKKYLKKDASKFESITYISVHQRLMTY